MNNIFLLILTAIAAIICTVATYLSFQDCDYFSGIVMIIFALANYFILAIDIAKIFIK